MIFNFIQSAQQWLDSVGLYRFLQVFNQTTFRAVAAIILSFIIVLLMGKRTIRWLIKQKIGDLANFDHADLDRMSRQKAQTPTMGGIMIAAAVLGTTLLLADMRNFYVQMSLLCMAWLTILGGVDDWLKLTSARRSPGSRQGLHSWEKFVFQVGLALLLGFFIHHHGLNNEQTRLLVLPFQRPVIPGTTQLDMAHVIILGPWAFGLLTVFVIAGSSNAVNLTDGMDGLASGIMAIVSFAFILLCLITGIQSYAQFMLTPHIPGGGELGVVAGAMCGACLGFLWFNCHPAQVFMGDTGSLPLGGLIGFIAVVIRQELLLLLVGGVLVAEAASVILQVGYFKLSRGSRIFRCAPIHYHFRLGGWGEQQVVVRFWLITALLAAVALATLKLR